MMKPPEPAPTDPCQQRPMPPPPVDCHGTDDCELFADHESVKTREVESNSANDCQLRTVSVIENKSVIRHHNNQAVKTSENGYSNTAAGGGYRSESCLLEQLRVSENWKHLMAVEQGGQIKLNLKEQLSAQL